MSPAAGFATALSWYGGGRTSRPPNAPPTTSPRRSRRRNRFQTSNALQLSLSAPYLRPIPIRTLTAGVSKRAGKSCRPRLAAASVAWEGAERDWRPPPCRSPRRLPGGISNRDIDRSRLPVAGDRKLDSVSNTNLL
jgi:hypothetical protein